MIEKLIKRIIIKKSQRFLKEGKIIQALDLGAGDGYWSLFLAKQNIAVEAVDKDKNRLFKLKTELEKNEKLKKLICIYHQEIKDFSGKRNFYDLILCFNLLHLLSFKDYKKTIKKIYSLTKPGGDVLILVKKTNNLPLTFINDLAKFDIVFAHHFYQKNEVYLYLHLKKPPFAFRFKKLLKNLFN